MLFGQKKKSRIPLRSPVLDGYEGTHRQSSGHAEPLAPLFQDACFYCFVGEFAAEILVRIEHVRSFRPSAAIGGGVNFNYPSGPQ
jgi:hypothetical protein